MRELLPGSLKYLTHLCNFIMNSQSPTLKQSDSEFLIDWSSERKSRAYVTFQWSTGQVPSLRPLFPTFCLSRSLIYPSRSIRALPISPACPSDLPVVVAAIGVCYANNNNWCFVSSLSCSLVFSSDLSVVPLPFVIISLSASWFEKLYHVSSPLRYARAIAFFVIKKDWLSVSQ